MLSLQGEVARAIAEETRVRLSETEVTRLERVPNVHPDALHAYLKGRFFLNQRTRDGLEKALQHFEQAITIDPRYAHAYSGMADAHELFASYASVPPLDSLERGMKAALRALELDPELADAHTSLGTVYLSYTKDWERAEQAYIRALELNPSSALAHNRYSALLSYLGRHDQAITEAQRALELDPVSLLMSASLGIVYQRARRYDEAAAQIAQTLAMDSNYMLAHLDLGLINAARGSFEEAVMAFQRAITLAPDFGDLHALLGYSYARAGQVAEARGVGTRLRQLASQQYVSGYVLALYHLGLGEREQALDQLERAYADRSWLVLMLNVDPLLDPLRAEPRFRALVQRLEFPH
jgi:tetratricopeptide (TPR) repeat protein